jgi:prepilin-type N-terminal cleavage/methylation domain-containing protein
MKCRGSSLVESLVAMSILSIGSAATGAWFVRTTVDDARVSRSVAADAIAASLAARMRSNEPGVTSGGYTASSGARECAISCDAMALAADDMRRFHETLKENIGSAADGSVSCEMATACVIRITWQGREVLAWPFKA